MTAPFTPRPHSRSTHLGLSNKQLSKISGTIASVRRNRQIADVSEDEDVNERTTRREQERKVGTNGREVNGGRRERQVSQPKEPPRTPPEDISFAVEASFVRAPLNSRVVTRPSFPSPGPSTRKGKEKARDPTSLHGIPLEVQEALILEDLLHVLMGIPGTYVTVDPAYDPDESPEGGVQFAANPTLDHSLRDLVDRILPLATYYTAINEFMQLRSQLECGLVNHALCAAIRDMLKDYLTLVSQLEHLFNTSPSFTLQKLWFYTHPTLHTLSLIYSLTNELILADHPELENDEDEEEEEEMDEIDAINEELGLGFARTQGKLKKLSALEEAGIIKGGEVVAVLWDRVMNMSGDPTAHELYLALFRGASAPYAAMLERWTTTGHLKDPYEEFMVKESKDINRGIIDMDYIDDYWERRYTLRDGSTVSGSDRRQAGISKPRFEGGRLPGGACIPPLLDAWKQKVLLAGKYLNVIRECGIEVPAIQRLDEDVSLDSDKFYQRIEDAYTLANRALLKLLVKDQDLIPCLRSLKYYFFLSRSAYLAGFFENARLELAKPSKSASLNKLQSLFDLALASSASSAEDGIRGEVQIVMAPSSLYEFLTRVLNIEGAVVGDEIVSAPSNGKGTAAGSRAGENGGGDDRKVHRSTKDKGKERESKESSTMQAMDALTLDYKVKFPLSLIISRKAVLHYQLLFRFLLHLKQAEQSLTDMWSEHKSAPWSGPRSSHPDLERWKLRVIVLRSRMLSYVQQVLAFATGDILEPSWKDLERKLEKFLDGDGKSGKGHGKGGTVDQLLRDHWDFLNTCMKGCMLTSTRFLKLFASLLHTCCRFAVFNSKLTRTLESALTALADGDTELATSPMDKRWDIIGKFEMNFSHNHKSFYDLVQYTALSEVALLPLVHRLGQNR
ncbi:hypothetical protein FRB94_012869 [Tulasnella sp. JGI-2019a]|nr:hypothetical protein FRB94_012869 [Tulasnella sp. JGI-2019a]KAG9022840.1 hypothetical protein FRB95_014077 [Tulasnella sp. JGI-2019a]